MKKFTNELIKALIWISLFIIPLFILPITRDNFEINKMFLLYFLTLLLFGIWIFQIIIDKKIIIKKSAIYLPIIVLLIVWIFSTAFSINVFTSLFGNPWRFNGGLLNLITVIFLAFTIINTINLEDINFYLKAILASTILVSIIGILQNFSIINFIPNEGRVGSTLGQANFLGSFLMIGIFLAIYYFIIIKKIWWKIIFALIVFAPIIYCLILTGSRAAWFSVIFGIIIFIILLAILKFRKLGFIILLISLIAFLIFLPVIKQKYRSVNLSPQGTIYSRIYAWKAAIKIAEHHPIFGTGPETFLYAMPAYRDSKLNLNFENWTTRFDKAHNEFLNLLATTGILGLIAFFYLLYVVLAISLKSLKNSDSQTKILIISILSGIVALLASVMTGFFVVSTWLIFWFLISVLAILENHYIWKNKTSVIYLKFFKNKIIQAISLTIITAFIIWSAYFLGKIYLAEVDFSHGDNLNATKLNPYIDLYMGTYASEKNSPALAQKAIQINPHNPDNWENYAQIETNYLKSKNAYLQAENLDPSNAKLYFELGQLAKNNNDLSLAKSQLMQAIELKSDYTDAINLLNQIK
jgi:O-antigen ligase